MKSLSLSWKRFRQKFREPRNKKKAYIFLLCLVSSAFFWLFIKLSHEAQMAFEQPLMVINRSSDQVVSHQNSFKVGYTLQTTGAQLLFSRFFRPADTLRIDVQGLGKVMLQGEMWHYVSANQLRSFLLERLEAGSQLTGIWPDTVFVKLDYASEKKVPIRLDGTCSFEREFGLYGPIELNPDSVIVRGPRQVIDTLQVIPTESLIFENLKETVQQTVALVNPAADQGLSLNINESDLTIPVEKYTETVIELNIGLLCQHGDTVGLHQIRLFPNRVTVTCLVALKDFGRVDASLFEAHVVCPIGSPMESERLEVFVDTFPDFVTIQSIRPASVEFLILE